MTTANTRMGLGLYSLAGVYGKKDQSEIRRMLEYAVDAGIEHYDVADQYGPAEEVLGSILKPYRYKVEIGTKVGMPQAGLKLTGDYINEACRKSLKRLDSDYIDYYQVHFDDEKTAVEEIVFSLEELQKGGLIRKYGLGHVTMERFLEYLEIGNPVFLMLEISMAVLKNYNKFSSICNKKGVKMVATSATARGLLTGTIESKKIFQAGDIRNIDPLFHKSIFESAGRIVSKLKEQATKINKTPVQVALAWLRGLDGVETVLVGPSTVAHLEENIGGFEFELPCDIRQELNDLIIWEEERKAKSLIHDIEEIIEKPLSNDIKRAVADLVYVLEGLVSLGKAPSQLVAPIFKDVMIIYRKEVAKSNHKLNIIKERLASIYKL